MKTILTALSDMAVEPFAWCQYQGNPVAALAASGVSEEEAVGVVQVLARAVAAEADKDWQSCETCWDPGEDGDPFDIAPSS